jgi:hypothetical protein
MEVDTPAMRSAAIGVSSEVISGILNCVCPDCAQAWVELAESSSAGENVRRIGVRSGRGSDSYPQDSTVRQESDHTEFIE